MNNASTTKRWLACGRRVRSRHGAQWPVHFFALFIVPVMLLGSIASAQDLTDNRDNDQNGHFEIRSAYSELDAGIYYLNARVDFRLSESAAEALRSGLALTFELQIHVNRTRKYLPDPEIADLKQRYRLEHHALSDRYVLTNLNSGERESFASLTAALGVLGRVEQLPILDESLLEPARRYEISLRAFMDTGGLPGPVRLLAFWREDWRLASEWYRWPLRP